MLNIWKKATGKGGKGLELGRVPLGGSPWLVLGGGGLKGLAHLGAWRALREAGFEPDGILGTSIGALVGACLAGGRDVDDLEAEARRVTRADIAQVRRRAVWFNGLRATALFRGQVLRDFLQRVLPAEGWEALTIRFQLNAVELGRGRTEWFGIGARTDVPLADAVYASNALPVHYPPARLPGGLYVDGGTEDALPLERAAKLGATSVVAVDVGSGEEADAEAVVRKGMLAIHERVFGLMSGRRRREAVASWNGPPLLFIRPRLDGYGTFDFDHIGYFLEEGYRAAREALGAEAAPGGGEPPPKGPGEVSEDAPVEAT
jgi:NTE family protein